MRSIFFVVFAAMALSSCAHRAAAPAPPTPPPTSLSSSPPSSSAASASESSSSASGAAAPASTSSVASSSSAPESSSAASAGADGAGGSFPAARFARLTYPSDPEAQERWSWPAQARFERQWEQPARAAAFSWRLLEGTLVLPGGKRHAGVSIAVRRAGDEGTVVFGGGGWDAREALDGAVADPGAAAAAAAGETLELRRGGAVMTFRVDAAYATAAPAGDAWADWSYATTLLEADEELFLIDYDAADGERAAEVWGRVSAAMERSPEEGLAALPELLSAGLSPEDRVWGQAATWAEEQGDLDLAIELRRRFWPRGYCSMDRSPQVEGMKYADVCAAAGRTGCYLQLQVRVMGDGVGTRNAWSSYGEASFPTYVERIEEIGIDVERFLLGLAWSYDADEERAASVGPWRLARAMVESGRGDAFDAALAGAEGGGGGGGDVRGGGDGDAVDVGARAGGGALAGGAASGVTRNASGGGA